MKLVTKQTAVESNLTRFYTGVPCKNGHDGERLTSSGECIGCKQARERRKHKEPNSYTSQRYANNRDDMLAKQLERQKNSTTYQQYQQDYRDSHKAEAEQYRKDNAGYFAFHASARKRRVRQATPDWSETQQILKLYERAAELTRTTGIKHEVDHVIPIKNDLVCGLHCLDNLQILTKYENCKKGNRWTDI